MASGTTFVRLFKKFTPSLNHSLYIDLNSWVFKQLQMEANCWNRRGNTGSSKYIHFLEERLAILKIKRWAYLRKAVVARSFIFYWKLNPAIAFYRITLLQNMCLNKIPTTKIYWNFYVSFSLLFVNIFFTANCIITCHILDMFSTVFFESDNCLLPDN